VVAFTGISAGISMFLLTIVLLYFIMLQEIAVVYTV